MKNKEDIFNFFKDKQEGLDEMPSSQVWRKLENRLDERSGRQKRIFFRQTIAAAAVFLAIVFVAALSVFNPKGNQFAADEKTGSHDNLTAMSIDVVDVGDYREPLIMSHLEQKRFSENLSKEKDLMKKSIPSDAYIADGKILSRDDKEKDTETSGLIAEVIDEVNFNGPAKTKELRPLSDEIADNIIKTGESQKKEQGNILAVEKETSRAKELNNKSSDSEEIAGNFNSTTKMEIVPETTISESSVKSASGNLSTNDIISYEDSEPLEEITLSGRAKSDKNKTASKKSEADSKERDSAKDQVRSEPAAEIAAPAAQAPIPFAYDGLEDNTTTPLNARSNVVEYKSLEPLSPNIQDIRLFEWIIGEWKVDDGRSFEVWNKKDRFSIEGKGYFIVNGDTLLTEGMKISKIKDQVYFIVAIDATQKERKYRLKSYTGQEAVFINESLDFPNQVILKKESTNNFSTIMQNDSPSQMDLEQQRFLLNRNQLEKEKAFRNLSRVKD